MLVKQRMRRDPIAVSEDEELATALQLMLWNGARHLPVLRDGKLVGVISERDVLRAHDPASSSFGGAGKVRDSMTRGAVIAHPTDSLGDAAARMLTEGVACLPVIDGSRVAGMITVTDLLAEIATCTIPTSDPPALRASELMTRDPIIVHPDDPLVDAAMRMVQRGIRHLPVVDGAREVLGMLSDRELRSAMGNPFAYLDADGHDARIEQLRVADVMAREPRVLREDATLAQLLGLLVDERLDAVLIVGADNALSGIVSYVDVLRATSAGRISVRAAAPA
jgi:acetoin utilization protein AcuB